MNKKQISERAIELRECAEKYESVDFLESDTEFFGNIVEIVERNVQEVPIQEQYAALEVVSKEKRSNDKKVELLAEVILKEMTEKELPRIILDKALKIVDRKFLNDATI